jgi:peptide/nickel transport system ATP-binding protein
MPPIFRDLSLSVRTGETVGLTGPSAAGKSSLVWATLQILPSGATLTGSIRLEDVELVGQKAQALRAIRGRVLACIPQQPALALHPLIRVGAQVENVLKSHGLYSTASRDRILGLFHRVKLSERCFHRYPHQLSGGEAQRALIVQALICGPRLLIADEPFAALDSPTRRELQTVFDDLKRNSAVSFLLISHDLELVAGMADRVLSLRNGKLSELSSGTQRAE